MSPEHPQLSDLFAVISNLKAEVAELRAELAERDSELFLVRQEPGEYRAPRYATCAELCRELNVKRTWAYQHRQQLGAVKFGDGKQKPRLRWDMDVARPYWAALAERAPEPEPSAPRRRRKKPASSRGTSPGKPVRAVPKYKFA